MKKITLSLLISLPLIGGVVATLALTPFHPKRDDQVQVVLSADVMAQSGRPFQAWSGLQDEFNQTLTDKKLPKIRIFWDNKDILTKTISNYQLPDLYLTKPSNLPIYNASSQRKNMRSFSDYAHYYNPNLLAEYEFGSEQKLLGLPLYKSFDCGVVNVKRLKELGFDWDTKKLNSLSYQDLDEIIKKGQELEIDKKDPLIGFDDLPNQLYLSQNNNSKAVGTTDNPNFTFSYRTTDKYQNYDLRYNINPQIATYFESWKKSGLFTTSMIKGGVKTYTSNEFLKGKMVYTASSSAGLFAFQKNTTYDYKTDLAIVKNASLNGGDNLYYSQGIGIGGFKSVGKNYQEKEATVKLFMDWLLGNPLTLSTLASNANYLPATIDGNTYFNDSTHLKPGTKYPFATDLYKAFYDQDPLNNSTFQIMNPADYIVRNTLSNIWINIYWTSDKLTFTDVFCFSNYKKYTNFGDLFNRSKVVK
ncbi:hypothetical protein [Mesoplasma whartonense]|uniref:hypothetical protein n=1 Tax=Mesoplasma whartonense TaxID=2878854 RepID=UPI002022A896|nr:MULTISPECIES: hypothetical protein [unclassified Mesoplasma]MCL8212419.1 hypothetical protein [Mesoplasma sp. JKS002661]MCL8213468.1 hypothetical protein [Mesoplasma sp. JKS002660]MCL8215841.1 hypothetical protein [Mesoplasma sp. JKS002657]